MVEYDLAQFGWLQRQALSINPVLILSPRRILIYLFLSFPYTKEPLPRQYKNKTEPSVCFNALKPLCRASINVRHPNKECRRSRPRNQADESFLYEVEWVLDGPINTSYVEDYHPCFPAPWSSVLSLFFDTGTLIVVGVHPGSIFLLMQPMIAKGYMELVVSTCPMSISSAICRESW